MSFVYPWFLFALLAVSIPVIIHLFQFRRFRKVYFPSIRFLEQISDETHQQARLKHLLVLLMRILAIVFLVMAFARPYLPSESGAPAGDSQQVSIYIDNSFSMEATSVRGTLLDQARMAASEIVSYFQPTDRFMLLTNDFEGRHQRLVSREEFLAMLQEVDFSAVHRPLGQVVERQRELLSAHREHSWLFVVSDFQKIVSDFSSLEPDTLIRHFFLPVQADRPANVFIDSVWIENPVRMSGQLVQLKVRVVNDTPESLQNQPLRLFVNGSQRSVATFDATPGGQAEVSMGFTLGSNSLQQGWVELTDFPVLFDDRMYFSFRLTEKIPVLAIGTGTPNPFLQALLGRDTTFVFTRQQVGSVDFSTFAGQNLIVLDGLEAIGDGLALELRRFVEEGGKLVVFPSQRAQLPSYNSFLGSLGLGAFTALDTAATRVASFNELHPIYAGVFDRIPENIDLPRVSSHFVLSRPTASRQLDMMTLQNGNPFFVSAPAGQGEVYVSVVPANDGFSNFPRHAMFVPTLYNIGLHSASRDPLYMVLGRDDQFQLRQPLQGMNHLLRIRGENTEVIPETRLAANSTRLLLHGQIHQAGHYLLMLDDQVLHSMAFNYDRRESRLESYSMSEIERLLSGQPNAVVFEPGNVSWVRQLEQFTGGRQLWKIFLWLALACLMAEVLLLRFWR